MAESRRVVAVHARLCGLTDQGRERECNEDTFLIAADGRVLVVADGMGGHQAGEIASALAVARVAEFLSGPQWQEMESGRETVPQALAAALEEAHRAVSRAGREDARCRGMGATLILGYLAGDELHTGHVGDVRGYVQGCSGLEQITRDHSVVAEWVRLGRLKPAEARVHPARNQVLQALGASTRITPELHRRSLVPGDVVLLCSDGLWRSLADEEIGAILAGEGSLLQRATRLVDRAGQAGGEDDVTVVVYQHA